MNYDFFLFFLSIDVYLYYFINFIKRKILELLIFFGYFIDCCWMILGWISVFIFEFNIKESGLDVYYFLD